MSEKRSLVTFEHCREGEQRFEYFIAGVSTALCTYVGETLQPQKFGLSPRGRRGEIALWLDGFETGLERAKR